MNHSHQTINVNTPSHGASTAADRTIDDTNDRYATSILRGALHLFGAFEVHGVRDLLSGTDAADTQFEVDNTNPESFSVYARYHEGGADAVGDHSTYEQAALYAKELSEQYKLPVFDYVPATHKGGATIQ